MRLLPFESLVVVIALLEGVKVVSAALVFGQTTISDVLPSEPHLLRRFHAGTHATAATKRHLRAVDATRRRNEMDRKLAAGEEERMELAVTFQSLLHSVLPSIRVTPQMMLLKCDVIPALQQIRLPAFIRYLIKVFGGSCATNNNKA
jgi:hypothetical protein